jgi:hypothetical protein
MRYMGVARFAASSRARISCNDLLVPGGASLSTTEIVAGRERRCNLYRDAMARVVSGVL